VDHLRTFALNINYKKVQSIFVRLLLSSGYGKCNDRMSSASMNPCTEHIATESAQHLMQQKTECLMGKDDGNLVSFCRISAIMFFDLWLPPSALQMAPTFSWF